MTYVPPKKKQKGGTSGFGDLVYVLMFYIMEGLFIFIGIPFLILAFGVIPVAMFLVITRGGGSESASLYILISFGVLIVFFQILGMQFFVRKYVLEPHKMTFGEWLRWKFSPTEIKKRRTEKIARSRKMEEWYGSMDRVYESRERLKDEQQYNLRGEWFGEDGDPEMKASSETDDATIVLGEIEEISDISAESSSSEPENLEIESIEEDSS
ncbi:MAG: hypothetical protein HZR80_06110 [Candidatus Heimdallarchaeota archaeon]